MRQERSNGVLHSIPAREAAAFAMRAGLVAIFDQQVIEIWIGADDRQLRDRFGKCHLIRIGSKFDLAAQESFQRGSTAIAAMNEPDAAWQEVPICQLPTD